MITRSLLNIFSMIAFLFLVSPSLADKAVLVLDASGSMWGKAGDLSKMDIAKSVVGDLLSGWSSETELGVMAYGHREKNNCNDIEMIIPLGKPETEKVVSVVHELSPKGKTPITQAVKMAAQEMKSEEGKATVILISDGIETCNADPCAVARELKKSGVDFKIHVVGFGTSDDENRHLQCISDATGGNFYTAKDAGQLKKAMISVKKVVKKQAKKVTTTKVAFGLGKISIKNSTEGLYVYNKQGKSIGFWSTSAKTPVQVVSGTYHIKVGKEDIKIDVGPGKHVKFDIASIGGWISIKSSVEGLYVYNEKGKSVGFWSTSGKTPVQVIAGTYRIKVGKKDIPINVKPGEHIKFDIASVGGWISLKNSVEGLYVYNEKGKSVGFWGTSAKTPVQVSAGNYYIKVGGQRVDIAVKPGEHRIIDFGR